MESTAAEVAAAGDGAGADVDDGLLGDDVCAHPTTNTVPTTTATADNEARTDIDHSFVNDDAR
jgi:hypothetical protein